MKTLLKFLAILTVLAFSFAPELARAQDDSGDDSQDVSFQTFYDQLGDQGSWVQTDDYGYVFQPNVDDPDWQPYTNGTWVESDAGLTWDSDEPWGWATYHYGRWANIDGLGWVWVPGYEWAPAWVSWRYGGGYCGWAPLPPETLYGAEYEDPGVNIGVGFHFGGDVDVAFDIGPGCYNFIRVEDIGERNYRHHFENRSRNYELINHTTNFTNINVNHGAHGHFRGVTAGGPPVNELNAHARQRIETVQLTQSNQPGKSMRQGNKLAVFAPKLDPNSVHQAKPAVVAQSINHPTFNRGDSISKPLDVTRNIHGARPSAEAIQAATQAQASVPASAKIATPNAQPHVRQHQPFTALAPVEHNGNPGNPGNNPANSGIPNTSNQQFHSEHHSNNGGGQGFQPQQQQSPVVNPQERPAVVTPPPMQTTPQVQEHHWKSDNNPGDNQAPQSFHHEKQATGGDQPQMQQVAPMQPAPQVQEHHNPPPTFQQHEDRNPQPTERAPAHMENPSNNGGFHSQAQNPGGNGNNHPSGGGQGQGGGNHPSGGGQGGGNHAAPANNPPSDGGDGKKDKKP